MARVRRLTLALIVLAALPAPAAAAVPVVHADRGAHTAYGRPELGEDTLPAVRVVARRSARAGRLAVTIDGRRRVVATAGATAPRVAVFDSGRLRSGRHRVVLRPAGDGRVEVDAVAPS
jgi:hypothetical protein